MDRKVPEPGPPDDNGIEAPLHGRPDHGGGKVRASDELLDADVLVEAGRARLDLPLCASWLRGLYHRMSGFERDVADWALVHDHERTAPGAVPLPRGASG